MAELPLVAIRDAILTAIGQPLDLEVVISSVMPDTESGTLTRNLKIRRGPMATWIQARLSDQDVRLQCHFFPRSGLNGARFIDHLPTIQRIEGNSYLVIRIADHPAASAFAALQQALRERLERTGEVFAKEALIPTSLHLTLAEWHGQADTNALLRLVRQWANAQRPLSLYFDGLRDVPAPSCLLMASACADLAMRDALRALRAMARSENLACVEQVPVDEWLFHVSLAHCPALSSGHWRSMINDLPMQLMQFEALRADQVELVHYRGHRELPAHVVPLCGESEVAS
ncbi:2'-5' RNA ligase family protein [Pseudomonas promysalinigenes]|uniref:2'-5' RNA ligase family protein n=1 Tax=Pseudomonas promysalinigenes TaxID=485898 RepID=UPI003916FB08